MQIKRNHNYLIKYIEHLQSEGRYTFSLIEIKKKFQISENALKLALARQVKNRKIISIRKGFYIIIPPEYFKMGILPPVLFIDDMMKYINKPYYVGLLSAAALHGAAHQQPQEFYVITNKPANRAISKNDIKINFMIKSEISIIGISDKKTDTGYVKVSTPELTAIDLIQYANRIGGFNRVATILHELAEEIDDSKFEKILKTNISMAILQRLGYIFEHVLELKDLSNTVYKNINKIKFRKIPLDPSKARKGYSSINRWKIIENTVLESDL